MKDNRIFALYKGDTYIMDGTMEEIAKARGCKKNTISFLNSPAYKRRKKERDEKRKHRSDGYLTLTYLGGSWEKEERHGRSRAGKRKAEAHHENQV